MIRSGYSDLLGVCLESSGQSREYENEDDLKEIGQIEIVLPWEEGGGVSDDYIRSLRTTLESRGYDCRLRYRDGDVSCEKHVSLGQMTGGTEGGIHEGGEQGVVNHIVNGVYVQEWDPVARVVVVRPEDVVGETSGRDVVYVVGEGEDLAEIGEYLSSEGRMVGMSVDEVIALLRA